MTDDNIQPPITDAAPESGTPDKKMYSQEKLEEIIRERHKAENQRRTEAEARAAKAEGERDVLRQQHEAMLAQMQQPQQPQQDPQMQPQQSQGSLPLDTVEKLLENQKMEVEIGGKLKSFDYKMEKSMEQDDEFKKLYEKEGNPIPPQAVVKLAQLDYIQNMPAVVKHLLKDKGDYEVFKNASSQMELVKFVNELSNKLSNIQQDKPKFESPKDFDSTSGAGEFSGLAYLKEKRGIK